MIPEKPKGLQATPDQWKAIATRGNNLLVSGIDSNACLSLPTDW